MLVVAGALLAAGILWLGSDSRTSLERGKIYPPKQLMTAETSPDQLAKKYAECHQQEYEDWLHSQHANAQRPITLEDHSAFAGPIVPAGETTIPLLQAGQPGFRNQQTGEFFPLVR